MEKNEWMMVYEEVVKIEYVGAPKYMGRSKSAQITIPSHLRQYQNFSSSFWFLLFISTAYSILPLILTSKLTSKI